MAHDPLDPLLAVSGVAESVAEARDAVDRLLAHRVLRRASGRVSAESALRGGRCSAALDGHSWPLAQVRSGAAADPHLTGALRATAEVGSLVELWQRAPRQALARLHAVAARGLVVGGADGELGRPRVADELSVRLEGLTQLLTQPVGRGGTAAPAVVVAAVVHGELLTLDTFSTANGVVARAAERLTLVARGLDPKALTIPELGHLEQTVLVGTEFLESSDQPVEAIAAYRADAAAYAAGTEAGLATWVARCARSVALGARESLAVCEAVQRG